MSRQPEPGADCVPDEHLERPGTDILVVLQHQRTFETRKEVCMIVAGMSRVFTASTTSDSIHQYKQMEGEKSRKSELESY